MCPGNQLALCAGTSAGHSGRQGGNKPSHSCDEVDSSPKASFDIYSIGGFREVTEHLLIIAPSIAQHGT